MSEISVMKDRIRELAKEKNARIFAHYYVPDDVQDIADEIGDSFYLARRATETDADMIVLCGVRFMGESAKILNPGKKVIIPEINADCPMANMATVEMIREVRKEYPGCAVVCYVNSTAELKAESDVCVTSANALNIVRKLPAKDIYFIPDRNLAHFIDDQLPEKHFIFNDGFCHVHNSITPEQIDKAKELKPGALVLVHPECVPDVVSRADYVGSTSGIIKYVDNSDADEFIIVTEMGVLHQLKTRHPDKKFYTAGPMQLCPNMKKVSLERVLHALSDEEPEITLTDDIMDRARRPMEEMLRLA